jgi:hypothetical protein
MSKNATKKKGKGGRPTIVERGQNVGVFLPKALVELLDRDALPEYRSRSAQVRKILDAYYYNTD